MLRHGRFTAKAILKKRWKMSFSLILTTTTVTDNGRTENVETEIEAVGNIQPATAEVLERLPESDRSANSITVNTPTMLTAGTDTRQADVILYKGEKYLVKAAWAWGDYGFCKAVAALQRTRGVNV